jgi:hypothetical protein
MSDQATITLSDHHVQEKLKEAFQTLSTQTVEGTDKLLNCTRSDLLTCGGYFCERNDGSIDKDTILRRFAERTLEHPGQKRIEFQFALHKEIDSRICCPVLSPVIAKAVQETVAVRSDPDHEDIAIATVQTATVKLWCMDPPVNSQGAGPSIYYLSAYSTEVRQAYKGGSNSRCTTEEATGYVGSMEKFTQVLDEFVRIASTPSR